MSEEKCKECGSADLRWDHSSKVTSGVVQGRLRTEDVKVFFFLRCEECSETIKIIDCDKVADILNQKQL